MCWLIARAAVGVCLCFNFGVKRDGEANLFFCVVFFSRVQGLLHEGDELIEVNEIDLRGRSLDEVCELLVSGDKGENFMQKNRSQLFAPWTVQFHHVQIQIPKKLSDLFLFRYWCDSVESSDWLIDWLTLLIDDLISDHSIDWLID